MAEKRKFPTRERREQAAKRRASEATQTPHSQKTIPAIPRSPTLEPVEDTLPIRIKDGEALPTVLKAQLTTLSAREHKSVAESGVLLASLERSKKKWLSDGIFDRYWTKPKKTKKEQIEGKNPPKESMLKVGPCKIIIEPHHFDAMLYTVKDPNVKQPIQYAPSQRPMVHYGPPNNNFHQYQPFPPANQTRQQPSFNTSKSPPQHSYDQRTPPSAPPRAPQPRTVPQPRTPQNPLPAQRPEQAQPPQQPPQQPPKPSPDPVIQMLATRAASNPELKALMRVVASSKASQEQLRTFQAHIDELNAIIRNREQQAAKVQAQQQQQQQQPPQRPQNVNHNSPPDPMPHRSQPPSTPAQHNHVQNGAPQARHESNNTLPASARSTQASGNGAICVMVPPPHPGVQPSTAPDSSAVTPSPTSRSLPPSQPVPSHSMPQGPPPQQSPSQIPTPPIRARNSQQYSPPTTYYHQSPSSAPPPKPSFKAVVFEFTSPLTPYGSSASGHAGSGDRYLFPENSILEFLPGGNTVIASFLIIREVDPNAKFPIEATSETSTKARGKASRSKKGDKDKHQSGMPSIQGLDILPSTFLAAKEEAKDKGDGKDSEGQSLKDTDRGASEVSAPAEKEGIKNKNNETSTPKEFYQPVTIRIHSSKPNILEPLSRIVKPPAEVRKYMEDVMNRAERAPERFLALRLPRVEGGGEGTDVEEPSINGGTRTPGGKNLDDDSGVENSISRVEEEGEEEELKDFYDAPDGLPPLRV